MKRILLTGLSGVGNIEPMLRRRAGYEIDTSAPLDQVVRRVLEIALSQRGTAVRGRGHAGAGTRLR